MENKKIILAVVGLPGSGKTETTEYLIEKTGWPKIYFGQVVLDEIKKRGLDVNEKNEKRVREDLRKMYGMAAMAVVNIEKMKNLFKESNLIVESLYSWEEYLEVIKEFGNDFKVLAVFASPEVRIKRLSTRIVRPFNREEVISRDYSQIENLHQGGPIARADFTIVNNGTIEELHKEIDKILKEIEEE